MSVLDTIKRVMLVRSHPAGKPFIFISLGLSLFFLLFFEELGILMLVLTGFIIYFFRDPVRTVPQAEGLVVSPADGEVISISHGCTLPDDLAEEDEEATYTKISIFLSVFDAHVNRVPIAGTIIRKFYYGGKFLNAELDKASAENERACLLVQTESGTLVGFSQIAGLVARRIINDLEEGDIVETGERFGIIRFGSRADVYVPGDADILVAQGQRAIGGETVLANLASRNGAVWEGKAI
jgi:phosphatidylserine decarboxylase